MVGFCSIENSSLASDGGSKYCPNLTLLADVVLI